MKASKKVLKNGLRVVTIPMKDNPTVTVLVLVEAGSKYEEKKINGISHFLEHMCFKGTVRRPKAINISKELDSIGSQYNAFTSQEYTGYYAKADARHLEQIFDVISDIYLHSTFPEAEMEREKGVIIEEINMYEDVPYKHVQDLITKLLYGDQPAGWNIAGDKETVTGMKRDDFVHYKMSHYLPEATVLVVAGQAEEKKVLKIARKIFGSISRGHKAEKLKVKEDQSKPEVLIEARKTDQTHFVLAVRTYDLFNKKNYALSVLSAILGGGMSSRLFQKLREEMGVGYYVRAYNDPSTDHGFFQVSAGVDNKRVEEVVKVILSECKKLRNEPVEEEELDKVKEYLIGNMKLSLESSDDIANFYGGQEILKRKMETPEKKAENIRKVKARDVLAVAEEIFQDNKLNLALVGPQKDKAPFLKILHFSDF